MIFPVEFAQVILRGPLAMPIPVRHLPLIQNWDCQTCGDCCQSLEAVITDEEKRRIEGLDLAGDAEVAPGPWFVRKGWWWSKRWSLKHRPEGGCVFLTSGNRCRLHERFGAEVKPFACRLFPFLLLPAGDHWRVGIRYSCPEAAANRGRPVTSYKNDLVSLTSLLEKHVGRTGESAPPPALQGRQLVPWKDIIRFVEPCVEIVEDRSNRLERRLRKCLAFAKLCRQARFDNLTGGRLSEFLGLARAGVDGEVPRNPADVPAPGWIGRVLFRTLLAVYAKQDWGRLRRPGTRTRLGSLRAGWRFVRGKGGVPRSNTALPEITFAEVESRPALPVETDEILERYYRVKISSLQFCGPPNFNQSFWAGLETLAATLPMIQWLAKAMDYLPPPEAVQKAIRLVDDHFGGNPVLGFRHNRYFVKTLASRGEIAKLIAWYSCNHSTGNV